MERRGKVAGRGGGGAGEGDGGGDGGSGGGGGDAISSTQQLPQSQRWWASSLHVSEPWNKPHACARHGLAQSSPRMLAKVETTRAKTRRVGIAAKNLW